jgi:hypothetical protein
MSIRPEDTTVGSRLNIHVSVIVLVGVSVNKRFIPWSVKEYIVLMNLNVNVSVRLIVDLYDSTVISCNTPISTSVNESTGRL